MPSEIPRRTWVEIDPAALRHNAGVAREAAAGAALMAVVKADGYGHGLAAVTRALRAEVQAFVPIDAFGVATLAEALAVRENIGPDGMVMVLGALLPDEREAAVQADVAVTVSSIEEARAYDSLRANARVHLVIDTGMGRMGFLEDEFLEALPQLAEFKHLHIEGVATHFPSADCDPDFTAGQIERFSDMVNGCGRSFSWIHLGNSAGILGFGAAGGNMVRPGLMLYGVSPLPEAAAQLQPALCWRARISQVRDLPAGTGISYGRSFVADCAITAATIAVGYGDGYPRHLSGSGAEVLVGGHRCPILGKVTMDQVMAEVSALPLRPQPGDTATLIGSDGGASIGADELAARSGTIPWEILTSIAPRVSRVVVET